MPVTAWFISRAHTISTAYAAKAIARLSTICDGATICSLDFARPVVPAYWMIDATGIAQAVVDLSETLLAVLVERPASGKMVYGVVMQIAVVV